MVFPGLPIPEFYAKVEAGIVTHVVAVENFQYIVDNPDRYGDSSLYVRTYNDDPSKMYGYPGFAYDAENDVFYDPNADDPADFPSLETP
jgi:hypothetical protein